MQGLGEGIHRVTLNLKLDEEKFAYQPITIGVQIKPGGTGDDGETVGDSHTQDKGNSDNSQKTENQ